MIVVADTSVILNLCRVAQQDLLPKLFHEVFIPPEVRYEFERAARTYPRFAGLTVPAWVHEQAALSIPENLRREDLDAGESAAIALVLQLRADALLIDETIGRHVAQLYGLTTIGLIGVLLRAKGQGLLRAIAPVLDELERNARFWVSRRVRQEALRLAGEAE